VTPVAIITGFLGAGKTTMIGRLLRDPRFGRTAVIVNEFGEIGLDHELIESADETLLTLTNGCLCCAAQGDLSRAFRQLGLRGSAYDKIIIETSGLADPGVILRSILSDRNLKARFVVSSVVTLVDPINAEWVLDRYVEAYRQIALADIILYSKPDLARPSPSLVARLGEINSGAEQLFELEGESLFRQVPRITSAFAMPVHTAGLTTCAITRDEPIPIMALALFLEGLREHCGERLLRLKGLVRVDEHRDGPVLIHFVQGSIAEPLWLDRWPSDDRGTRLVIIGQDLPAAFPERLLEALVDDVRGQMTCSPATSISRFQQ